MHTRTQGAQCALQAYIAETRGRRSMRMLHYGDAIQAIREAIVDGWGSRHGGYVANSYGYRAVTMGIYAAQGSTGQIRVSVRMYNAVAGSARYPMRACLATRHGHAAYWADTDQGGIVLSRRCAAELVRRYDSSVRSSLQSHLEDVPDCTVSVADSLAVGNCGTETHRVAAWFEGQTAISSTDLMKTVAERAPHLLGYARRAVDAAHTREVATAK